MATSTTQKKTVTVAIWEYHNPAGKRRRAFYGDVVELTDAEVERGQAAGIFDQPPAGPVDTPFISNAPEHKGFAAALAGITPRVPEPVGDDGLARLHHDIQPPETVLLEEEPVVEVVPVEPPRKPAAVANKGVLVQWVSDNARKDDGTQYTADEASLLNKEQLWAVIDRPAEG